MVCHNSAAGRQVDKDQSTGREQAEREQAGKDQSTGRSGRAGRQGGDQSRQAGRDRQGTGVQVPRPR